MPHPVFKTSRPETSLCDLTCFPKIDAKTVGLLSKNTHRFVEFTLACDGQDTPSHKAILCILFIFIWRTREATLQTVPGRELTRWARLNLQCLTDTKFLQVPHYSATVLKLTVEMLTCLSMINIIHMMRVRLNRIISAFWAKRSLGCIAVCKTEGSRDELHPSSQPSHPRRVNIPVDPIIYLPL